MARKSRREHSPRKVEYDPYWISNRPARALPQPRKTTYVDRGVLHDWCTTEIHGGDINDVNDFVAHENPNDWVWVSAYGSINLDGGRGKKDKYKAKGHMTVLGRTRVKDLQSDFRQNMLAENTAAFNSVEYFCIRIKPNVKP